MDTHEQACWLATLTGEVWPLPRAKEILREWTVDKHRSVAALLALSAEQAMQELGLTETEAAQLAELAGMAVSLQKELGKLARLDVRLISRTDAAYPEGLEQRLPEAFLPYYLFFCHDPSPLSEIMISVLGTPHPTDEAKELLQGIVEAIAAGGYTLVTTAESGIPALALDLWEAQASTERAVCVLPAGLRWGDHGEDPVRLWGRKMTLLSPYPYEAPSSTARLRGARLLTLALGELVVLISPPQGPSKRIRVDLPQLVDRRVLVWAGSDAECARGWLELGARPFTDVSEFQRCLAQSLGISATATETSAPLTAEETLSLLGQAGVVPPSLARRIREIAPEDSEPT